MRDHPLGFAKEFKIETCDVVTGIFDVRWPGGGPWFQAKLEIFGRLDVRLAPAGGIARASIESDANAIHFKLRQPLERFANDAFIAPSQQPIGRSPIPEIMLAAAFMD